MIIPTWTELPDLPGSRRVFVKSAIVRHGPVITEKGTYESPPEYMSRRHAVIDHDGVSTTLIIGSVSQVTKYDATDPFAVHKKYVDGEWTNLMQTAGAYELENALTWTGEPWKYNVEALFNGN